MSYLIHAFSRYYDYLKDFFEENKDLELNLSPKISIVSLMNKKCFDDSILVYQCKKNNIKVYNSETLYNIENWDNLLKIEYILEVLSTVPTEYTLFLDGKDCIFLKDIDDSFISLFKSYEADIIFNHQSSPYPHKIQNEKNKYINAGVCFGKTEILIKFYKEVYEFYRLNSQQSKSEQYYVREVANITDLKIKIDNKYKLFASPWKLERKLTLSKWKKQH